MAEFHWLLALGLVGFFVSFYLYSTKKKDKEPVCTITKGTCGGVLNSPYANHFGVDNTIFGVLYYGLIVVMAILDWTIPSLLANQIAYWFKLVVSGGALLFSSYLVNVMAFKLKKWCEWCVVSAIVSLLIFLIVLL